MSLLKLPFLISIIWSTYTTFTPPNTLQPAHSIPQSRLPLLMAPTVKTFLLFPLLVEISIILASSCPTGILSQNTLHLLAPHGTPTITTAFLLGWLVNLSGGLLRRACYRTLGRFFTFEVGVQKDQKLITTGPYSIVRHPSYTGAALSAIGGLLINLNPGSWIVRCSALIPNSLPAWSAVWLLGGLCGLLTLIPRLSEEDEMLKRSFGKDWEQWRERVPYQLIPWIY